MSKRLSKFIASFDYFDKSLIVLSVKVGGISDASIVTAVSAKIGIKSASFSLAFSMFAIVKKLLKTKRNKKRKSIIKLLC